MFHNRAEVARRLAATRGEVISDIDLATDASLISGMKPKKSMAPEELEDTISRLFTLMVAGAPHTAPEDETLSEDDISSLFTLMVVGGDDYENSNAESTGLD